MRTDLVRLLMPIQLVPILAASLHHVNRLLEVELKFLNKDGALVARFNAIVIPWSFFLIRLFSFQIFPEVASFFIAVEVERNVLFASDIIFAHEVSVKGFDGFVHFLFKLLNGVVEVFIIFDMFIFKLQVDLTQYLKILGHLTPLGKILIVFEDLQF